MNRQDSKAAKETRGLRLIKPKFEPNPPDKGMMLSSRTMDVIVIHPPLGGLCVLGAPGEAWPVLQNERSLPCELLVQHVADEAATRSDPGVEAL
jgi:hypothetical protein